MAGPLTTRIKRLTLVACVLGSSIALLDATVVNVALPAITRDLHGGLSTQQWIVDAYALTLGSLILVGGSLGDVLGEKRVFAVGVAGFGITSLGCALAPTSGVLIGLRALQGVAGALLTPASLAVITSTFQAEERGAAVGTWTAWGAIAGVTGPLVGGVLTSAASWRWIFLINIPLVVVTLVLVIRFVPATGRVRTRHLDIPGAVLAALGLGGPVFALIEQPRLGWTSPGVLGPFIVGLILLVAFVLRERSARDPMLPLGLFSRPNFGVANLETLVMYAGLAVLFFLLSLFLQEVGGWTPTQAGLATLPSTIVMFLLSKQFGRMADRLGPRFFMGAGPLVAAVGLLLFLRGLSMTVAPLTATVLAAVQEGEAGIASAVNNAVARVAGLAGVAALGPIIGSQLGVSGFHLALGAAAGLLVAAGTLGATLIVNPARRVLCEQCPGGQLAGAAQDAARPRRQLPRRVPTPSPAPTR